MAIRERDLVVALQVLMSAEPDMEVTGVVRTWKDLKALRSVEGSVDLVILDSSLPGIATDSTFGIDEALSDPGIRFGPRVLVLARDETSRRAATRAEADAIVVLGESPEELLGQIRAVMSGSSAGARE